MLFLPCYTFLFMKLAKHHFQHCKTHICVRQLFTHLTPPKFHTAVRFNREQFKAMSRWTFFLLCYTMKQCTVQILAASTKQCRAFKPKFLMSLVNSKPAFWNLKCSFAWVLFLTALDRLVYTHPIHSLTHLQLLPQPHSLLLPTSCCEVQEP